MSPRVLITGAAGFIGSRVVRGIIGTGEIIAVDRSAERLAALSRESPAISVLAIDISDRQQVLEMLRSHRPDAVVHLAWYADPQDYLTSHANLDSLNVTTRFIEAVLEAGCRKVVVAGSCAEYAPKGSLLVETDPAKPNTLYGATKAAAASIVALMGEQQGAEVAWARIFHLHGPGENERRLIPWVAKQLATGVPVDLTDGTQIRDHLHVDDVAAGLTALLTPGATGIFNICSGIPVSLREVLEIVGDVLGRPELLRFGGRPRRQDEPMFLAGDSTKLRGIGWSPRFALRDGLADSLRDRYLS